MKTSTTTRSSSPRNRRVGGAGERAAAKFLEKRGYRVVGSGFLSRRGELDLVCRKGDELVVVEVKTRSQSAFGDPAEAINARKRRAIGAATAEYRALAAWRGPIRFAVVSVVLDESEQVMSLELLEDPF